MISYRPYLCFTYVYLLRVTQQAGKKKKQFIEKLKVVSNHSRTSINFSVSHNFYHFLFLVFRCDFVYRAPNVSSQEHFTITLKLCLALTKST